MFVKDFMTKDPIVVPPQASIPYTAELMQKHGLKRLPVIDNGKLVGVITEKDIARCLPSPATTLSKHEMISLTSKMIVSNAMTKKVITTTLDTTVEEAVMLMRSADIGCLPIIEQDKVVGIITESNVFEALTNLLGLKSPGLRITIEVEDRIGVIADLTAIIKDLGLPLITLATFMTSKSTATIIMRIATEETDIVLNKLTENGYTVSHWTVLH